MFMYDNVSSKSMVIIGGKSNTWYLNIVLAYLIPEIHAIFLPVFVYEGQVQMFLIVLNTIEKNLKIAIDSEDWKLNIKVNLTPFTV